MSPTKRNNCLLISDSFSETMGVYFHNEFYNTIRIHPGNPYYNLSDLIKTYHPQIIVFEIAEQNTANFSNSFTPSLKKTSINIPSSSKEINTLIEQLIVSEDNVYINGWGYLINKNAANSKTYLKLYNTHTKKYYNFLLNQNLNLRIKDLYKNAKNLGVSGFSGKINQTELPSGEYKASIIIINGSTFGQKDFDKLYYINYPPKIHQDSFGTLVIVYPGFSNITSTKKTNQTVWLINGFSVSEGWGNWTNATKATMAIFSKNLPKEFKIKLSYMGFVTETHPKQYYEFYDEQDKLIKKSVFSFGSSEQTVTLDINKSKTRDITLITIKMLDPITPKAAGYPEGDERLLGLGLRNIKIIY